MAEDVNERRWVASPVNNDKWLRKTQESSDDHCPDCNGLGTYRGILALEPCRRCEGSGKTAIGSLPMAHVADVLESAINVKCERLEINCPTSIGYGTKIMLDGREMLGVTRILLDIRVEEGNLCRIEFFPMYME